MIMTLIVGGGPTKFGSAQDCPRACESAQGKTNKQLMNKFMILSELLQDVYF